MKDNRYSLSNKGAKKIINHFEKQSKSKTAKFNSKYVKPGDDDFDKLKDVLKSDKNKL